MLGVVTTLVLLTISGGLVVVSARRLEHAADTIRAVDADGFRRSAESLQAAVDELSSSTSPRNGR